jgi:HEAT repeat protein
VTGLSLHRDNGEIARLREEVASTRAMVALSLLQQQSATERLRGIDYSGRVSAEPEIVAALIQAVDHDPSVNVRLAAIDALSKASGDSAVLRSLTASLSRQDSPMVQAALVDYLADAHDRQAVGTLRQLDAQPALDPAVRARTQVALRELSQ